MRRSLFFIAEGGTFAESCELAAALEAVLDERALDMPDCVFTHSPIPANKVNDFM